MALMKTMHRHTVVLVPFTLCVSLCVSLPSLFSLSLFPLSLSFSLSLISLSLSLSVSPSLPLSSYLPAASSPSLLSLSPPLSSFSLSLSLSFSLSFCLSVCLSVCLCLCLCLSVFLCLSHTQTGKDDIKHRQILFHRTKHMDHFWLRIIFGRFIDQTLGHLFSI